MPTIQRFAACRINVYFRDHLPPHFHVIADDGREWLVEIETGTILRGPSRTREIRAAIDWAAAPENRGLLMQRFRELSDG